MKSSLRDAVLGANGLTSCCAVIATTFYSVMISIALFSAAPFVDDQTEAKIVRAYLPAPVVLGSWAWMLASLTYGVHLSNVQTERKLIRIKQRIDGARQRAELEASLAAVNDAFKPQTADICNTCRYRSTTLTVAPCAVHPGIDPVSAIECRDFEASGDAS